MKARGTICNAGAVALAFGLSGLAHASCNLAGTNADSVQSDSGNGTYNCTIVTASGGPLTDVSANSAYHVSVQADGTVTWTADVEADGRPADVDLISVARNSGKRCNYTYAGQPSGGQGLSTSDGGAAIYVTICADGVKTAAAPPPPPEPFSTFADGCTATFDAYGDNTNDDTFDVAFGYTKSFFEDGTEGVAVCAGGGEGQHQCVNECVARDVPENCTPNANGELPLSCAQCEWEYPDPAGSDKDLKYCWNWENRVCETGSAEPYCAGRGADTFIPSPKKKSLHAQIDVTTGSNCYTITVGPLYGGYTYSYQYCP